MNKEYKEQQVHKITLDLKVPDEVIMVKPNLGRNAGVLPTLPKGYKAGLTGYDEKL